MKPFDEKLQRLWLARERANDELYDAILVACPRPHAPRQHRDGKPPWCHACGRGNDGLMWQTERREDEAHGTE